MWKAGVCSVSFRQCSTQQIIRAAAAAGLDGIEWGADVHLPAGDTAAAAALGRETRAAGLQVLGYGGYCRLGCDDDAAFEALLASAAALGARQVRIWGGERPAAEVSDAQWQQMVDQARRLAQKAAVQGLVLSLECHPGTLTEDYTAALRFWQQVDSPALRLYWQPNQYKGEEYDLLALRAMAPAVTNVHVFAWDGDQRLPLAGRNEAWHKRLTILEENAPADEDHALLLEFMPDDRLESLPEEARVLCDWLVRRGHRSQDVAFAAAAARAAAVCLQQPTVAPLAHGAAASNGDATQQVTAGNGDASLSAAGQTGNTPSADNGTAAPDDNGTAGNGTAAPAGDPTLPLLPYPRRLRRLGPSLAFAADGFLQLDDAALYDTACVARRRRLAGLQLTLAATCPPAVTLRRDDSLPPEGYRLTVAPARHDPAAAAVTIAYARPAGAFYALVTLEQLLTAQDGRLPQLAIDDAPDYPVRGYMLDVGRNRIPTRAELFRLVDKLAGWKINQLQLYMEGVPFAYPSFPQMWQGRELLSGEDILALDAYCRARFIELVPCQNNFGHMEVWLDKEFRQLAECPQGYSFHGEPLQPPHCLDPQDPGSLRLVEQLAQDVLPYFSSDKYNICCDETAELGKGTSKQLCEARGMEAVYVDFVEKICAVARAHGRRPLLWDDIIRRAPEQLRRLPKDVVLLDWGYDAENPSADILARLRDLECDYYICPGTGGWNSYLGCTDKMLANISRSARMGLQYGASGLLNTDWGDGGHLQSISSCYAGIAYGAAMSWGVVQNEYLDLARALDVQLFEDAAGVMGAFVMAAGRYQRYEGRSVGNETQSMRVLARQDPESIQTLDDASFCRVRQYLAALAPRLEQTRMACDEAAEIKAEYRWALSLVDTLQLAGLAFKAQLAGDADAERENWGALQQRLPVLTLQFRRLWSARGRQAWLDKSVKTFDRLADKAAARLQALG